MHIKPLVQDWAYSKYTICKLPLLLYLMHYYYMLYFSVVNGLFSFHKLSFFKIPSTTNNYFNLKKKKSNPISLVLIPIVVRKVRKKITGIIHPPFENKPEVMVLKFIEPFPQKYEALTSLKVL